MNRDRECNGRRVWESWRARKRKQRAVESTKIPYRELEDIEGAEENRKREELKEEVEKERLGEDDTRQADIRYACKTDGKKAENIIQAD